MFQTSQIKTPLTKTVVEYFAGIGLVRLGLEMAGWKVLFANDYDTRKHQIYQSAFAKSIDKDIYHIEDIFNLSISDIPTATLATCSFPCIDLSLAGNQKGIQGVHSSAFWGFIEILNQQAEQASPILLIENVPGWLTSNKGQDFRLTIQTLNKLGYLCDVFELDARRFTPQSRPRVFVIATRSEQIKTCFEQFLTRSSALASKNVRSAVINNQDLGWNFLPIPPPPALQKEGFSVLVEDLATDDPRWWNGEKVAYHLSMMDGSHIKYIQQIKSSDHIQYRTMYRRTRNGNQRAEVRKSDTAGCLRTARGGSSRQIVIAIGQNCVRMRHMTSREYARLQGVPDWFPIDVEETQALNGFGDAVCVPVITWIAEMILNPLLGQSIKFNPQHTQLTFDSLLA